MNQYWLVGKAIGRESSCGEQDVTNLFDEPFFAENDEEARTEADKIVQRLEGEILRRADKDDEISIELRGTRRAQYLRFVPSVPAQPAVAARPATRAHLK